MSLVRLLTRAKSLEGVKGNAPRYEVTRDRLLPKFGGVANPFKATVKPTGKVETPVSQPVEQGVPKDNKTALANKAEVKATVNPPANHSGAALSNRGKLSWVSRCIAWLTRNRKTKLPAKPVPTFYQPTAGPTQGELLLDQVTPVRNDLYDSDVEVVAAKKPEQAPAVAPVEFAEKPAALPEDPAKTPGEKGWGRLEKELMDLGKS